MDPAPDSRPRHSLARWFWPFLVTILVLDIATKADVFNVIPPEQIPDHPPAHIKMLQDHWAAYELISPSFNPGVAWSMFNNHPVGVAILTLTLIPVLIFVFWRWFRFGTRLEILAFGSVLGGALGNGWDRALAMGASDHVYGVRDFINVHLGFPPFDPWPTFNVADIGISIGFVALVLTMFLPRKVVAPTDAGEGPGETAKPDSE